MNNFKNLDVKKRNKFKKTIFKVYDKLKQFRIKNRLTQKGLAEKTGISQQELSRIEKGQRNITIRTFFKISLALNYELTFRFKKS